ncbi:MAG: hypothetical protein CR967_00570 [Proteobacteria bacterium]|nr:MAG: hypothetical protein CR967_00570 [Pseudomonadota bacterium]
MQNFEVDFFDGISSKKESLFLHVDNNRIYFPKKNWAFSLKEIRICPKIANISQTIELPNGGHCILKKEDTLRLNNSFVFWMESKLIYSIISLVFIIGFIIFTLTYGSSWTAKIIANSMSQSAYESLGNVSFEFLEEHYLEPSELDGKIKEKIRLSFKKIAPPNAKLHFYKSPILKENALALPSGDIIMLDDLVLKDQDKSLMGIVGVLAHEIGHIEEKHSMQNIIKTSIVGFLSAYFIGDFSGTLASLGAGIVSLSYSREFEQEADKKAISIMKQHNYPITPLIKLFEALKKEEHESKLFSTHPLFKERIDFLKKSIP